MNALGQESANYCLQAKSGPPFVFANKVPLEHTSSYAHLCFNGCSYTTMAELRSFHRDLMAHKT